MTSYIKETGMLLKIIHAGSRCAKAGALWQRQWESINHSHRQAQQNTNSRCDKLLTTGPQSGVTAPESEVCKQVTPSRPYSN